MLHMRARQAQRTHALRKAGVTYRRWRKDWATVIIRRVREAPRARMTPRRTPPSQLTLTAAASLIFGSRIRPWSIP